MRRLTLLTDIPDWVAPLAEVAVKRGWETSVVGLDGPFEGLVFNRVSVSAGGARAVFERAPEVLASLAGVVNDDYCHGLGLSKWAQKELFERAGVATPETWLLRSGEIVAAREGCLVKPNAGGYGGGISAAEIGVVAPESLDDQAILQRRVEPTDGCVHRVEMIGGEPVYRAATPLSGEGFNYCLAGVSETEISREFPFAAECRRVAKLARLEVGSVEYLVDSAGVAWFIDMNPVSTYAAEVAEECYGRVLEYLEGLV